MNESLISFRTINKAVYVFVSADVANLTAYKSITKLFLVGGRSIQEFDLENEEYVVNKV